LSVDVFIDYLNLHPHHLCCFVDDGSKDGTASQLEKITATCSNSCTLILEKNQGKAGAVFAGIQYILQHYHINYIGYLDADLATPLSFVSVMEQELKTHPEWMMIFGSRQLADKRSVERKMFRHYSGRLVSAFITWALGMKFGDTQCGAKLFSKEGAEKAFQKPFVSSWVFDVEVIKRLLLQLGKEEGSKKIREIPVTQWKDVGNSKVSTWYIFKMCRELVRIKGMKK
jgi:dolichyl-phosphate beta-glucosyltransferase